MLFILKASMAVTSCIFSYYLYEKHVLSYYCKK